MDFFKQIPISTIHERKNQNVQDHDYLQLLMNAEGTCDAELVCSARVLTEAEIVSQCVLFFSVGYETSSQLLTYCTYCLVLNPGVQEKLFQEICRAEVQIKREESVHESLKKLKYLTAVVDETLRLYNPVLQMERRASEGFILPDTGIVVPEGMIVRIPVWALNHSEEYFPEPERFFPDRFLQENRGNIFDSTYLPFEQGPRGCIGTRFSLLETKLALNEIVQKYRFVPSAKTKIPLEFFPTGRPLLGPKAVYVGIEAR